MPPQPFDKPDYRPPYWTDVLTPLWERVSNCYSGLHNRPLKEKYLRKQLGEVDQVYSARVETVAFENRLKPAVKAHAGLLSEYSVDEDTPLDIREWIENVDGQRQSLVAYLLSLDSQSLLYNAALVIVDVPKTRATAESRARLITVGIRDIYAPIVGEIDGVLQIMQVAIARSATEPAGLFGVTTFNEYWVYSLQRLEEPLNRGGYMQSHRAVVEVWRDEIKDGRPTGNIVVDPFTEATAILDATGQPLGSIPLVWYSLYGDPVLFHGVDTDVIGGGIPEYMPLVDLNLEYFNKASELNTAEARSNFAIVVEEYPNNAPTESGDLLMSGRIRRMEGGGTMKLLEPACTAIDSTRAGQRDRLTRMDAIAQSFLTGGEVERTATEAVIESNQSRLSLKGIARRKESAIAQIFYFVKRFQDPSFPVDGTAGGVTVSDAAITVPASAEILTFWFNNYLSGGISYAQYQIKLIELGEWTDEMTAAAGAIPPQPNSTALPSLGLTGDAPNALDSSR